MFGRWLAGPPYPDRNRTFARTADSGSLNTANRQPSLPARPAAHPKVNFTLSGLATPTLGHEEHLGDVVAGRGTVASTST